MVAEDNPFVRFKNHIDSNIRRGWDVLFGSSVAPSTPSVPSSKSSSSRTITTSTITTAAAASTSQPSALPPSPSSSSSSYDKMSEIPSHRPSDASTSDQHTTSPTSPTATSTSTTSTTAMEEVHTWAVHSPYSPLNLQHLNQPTPRDAPRACEGLFTFRDAFEDLLVAGSGEPLPTSRTIGWKRCWRGNHCFPRNDVHAAQWVSGLGGLGLWDAYFTLETGTGKRMSRDDWDRFQKRMKYHEAPPFASVSVPGMRVGVQGWAGAERRERGEGTGVARGHFDAKGVWDGAWKFRESRWEVDGEERRDGDADVEDELYRANDNTSESGPGSSRAGLDTKRKDLRVVVDQHVPTGLRKPFASAPETTTTVYADGSRHVRKTERNERDGKTEISTTEHHFDAHGNLLSESHGISKTQTWSGSVPGASAGASFSWSWNSSGSGATGEGGNNSAGEERDGDGTGRWGDRKDGKGGWFWQR
ncbi:hypothetical protein F5Y12DRAFT_788626 [Xylaria sp. FL1777]|nr:hypothetical protein F5Y12DRAFT_788626 [Xylaria sp. FL1777]